MASYFVIGADGSKYGPADEVLLQEWIAQNRLTPDAELENANGQRMPASQVRELRFPGLQPPAPMTAPSSPGGTQTYAPQPGPQPFVGQGQAAPSPYYRQPQYQAGPQPMPKSDRSNGIALMVLAGIFAAFGIFTLISAFTMDQSSIPAGGSAAYTAGRGVGILFMSALWAAVGYGMMHSRKWAFITAIVLSVINICSVVTIYVLIYSIIRLSDKTGAAPT